MSWLWSLLGGRAATPWRPGDQLWCRGDAWTVTAVIVERSGRREWPTLRLTRGSDATWITIDDDEVARYDPLRDVRVTDEGRAIWNGRTYACTDQGGYTVVSVAGDVTAAVGDRAEYQTLTCADDSERWISVERWEGGATEMSAACVWQIDRVIHAPGTPGR